MTTFKDYGMPQTDLDENYIVDYWRGRSPFDPNIMIDFNGWQYYQAVLAGDIPVTEPPPPLPYQDKELLDKLPTYPSAKINEAVEPAALFEEETENKVSKIIKLIKTPSVVYNASRLYSDIQELISNISDSPENIKVIRYCSTPEFKKILKDICTTYIPYERELLVSSIDYVKRQNEKYQDKFIHLYIKKIQKVCDTSSSTFSAYCIKKAREQLVDALKDATVGQEQEFKELLSTFQGGKKSKTKKRRKSRNNKNKTRSR